MARKVVTPKVKVGDQVRRRPGSGLPAKEGSPIGTVRKVNKGKGPHFQATVDWHDGPIGPSTGRHPAFMLDVFHDRRGEDSDG
jgi:hypothetical protein